MASIEGNIQQRFDTAANFAASNRVLLPGEKAIESDTLREKVGDGETHYNDLPYSDEEQRNAFVVQDTNRNIRLGDGGQFSVVNNDEQVILSIESNGRASFANPNSGGNTIQFLGYAAGEGEPTASSLELSADVGYGFYQDSLTSHKYLIYLDYMDGEPHFNAVKLSDQPIEKRLSNDVIYDSVQYLEIADFTFNLLANRRYRVESCLRIFSSNGTSTVRLKFDNHLPTQILESFLRAEITGGSDLVALGDFFAPVDAAFIATGTEKLTKHIGEVMFDDVAEVRVSFAPKVDGKEFILRADSWIRFTDIT